MRPQTLAARAGRWSAQHRRLAILGWIAFVVAATVGGGMIGTNTLDEAEMGNGSSQTADLAVDKAGFRKSSGEQVLLQARAGAASEAELQQAAAELAKRLAAVPHVEQVDSPFGAGVRWPAVARRTLGDADVRDRRRRQHGGRPRRLRRSRRPPPSSGHTRTYASSSSVRHRQKRRSTRRSARTSSGRRRCRSRSR